MEILTANGSWLSVPDLSCRVTESAIALSQFADTYATTMTSPEDEFKRMLENYKDSIKLHPNTCINCGGGIDRETMLCRFCGTSYRI